MRELMAPFWVIGSYRNAMVHQPSKHNGMFIFQKPVSHKQEFIKNRDGLRFMTEGEVSGGHDT